GTTFETVFTLSTDAAVDSVMGDGLFATLSGLIQELNYRDRTRGVNGPIEQSAFKDATVTFTGEGTIRLIDDVAENSKSGLFMIVNDASGNGTLTDRAQVVLEGNPEMATVSIDGGERIRVRVGDEVTLKGTKPTLVGESTPQITLRIGAGSRDSMSVTMLNQGEDILEVEEQEFVGSLNGGPEVKFQNGDQNVFFISGVSEGVAESLMVDFDSILDITGPSGDGSPNTGVAILISTVNKALNFQVGPFKGQDLQLNIPNLRSDSLGFGYGSGRTVADINVTTIEGVNDAIEIIDEALDQISRTRSALGAFINRLETTVESLSTSSENLSASESRISDVDMASEVSDYSSNQILYQACTSVLAQANSLPQSLLSLLG
ncbi:MAG: flagellin, partial [Candidatus Hinthialibacter sp.]